jgi:hypothetical protein
MIGVAHRYGADLRRQGRELVGPCPACGTGRDRFSINPENSLFNCRICRRGGRGAIDLELFLGGGDFVDAVKRLVGLRAPSGQPRSPVDEAVPGAQAKKRMQVQAQSTAKQERIARWLWANREPAEGSVVETYLRARGYDGSIPKTIGFLSPRKEHASAMVSVYGLPIEFDGELEAPRHTDIKGVHLTKLLPDGSDRRRDRNANGIAKTRSPSDHRSARQSRSQASWTGCRSPSSRALRTPSRIALPAIPPGPLARRRICLR